jgi:hypothetical protein
MSGCNPKQCAKGAGVLGYPPPGVGVAAGGGATRVERLTTSGAGKLLHFGLTVDSHHSAV